MDVKRKLTYIFRLCLPLLLLLNACDDMEDKPFTSSDITGDPTETDTAELYALCEGLFNQNNSSLMRFSFNNQRMVRNYFKTINHRGLGDTANDLAIYGSKIIYCSQRFQYDRNSGFPNGKLAETDSNADRERKSPGTAIHCFS